jgi:hypothetical protein
LQLTRVWGFVNDFEDLLDDLRVQGCRAVEWDSHSELAFAVDPMATLMSGVVRKRLTGGLFRHRRQSTEAV